MRLLIALFLMGVQNIFAQPIFEVKKNELLLGYLAGSTHYGKFSYYTKNSDEYVKLISKIDVLYIEANPHLYIFSEERFNIFLNNEKSLEDSAVGNNLPCLKNILNLGMLNFWKSDNLYWSKSGPAAFIYQFGQTQIVVSDENKTDFFQGESLDSFIVKSALLKNKKIYELEGFNNIFPKIVQSMKNDLPLEAEAVCKSITSSKIKSKAVIEINEFQKKFDSAEIDHIRRDFINNQKIMGWSEKFIGYNLTERDKKNAKHIAGKISTLPEKFLIVVGVAHLGGDGLIKNLEELGFKINSLIIEKNKVSN